MDDSSRAAADFVASQLGRRLNEIDYRYLPPLAVLLMEGPRCSGKSALLSELEEQWRSRAPVRRIGFAAVGDNVSPSVVASALSDALRGSIPPLGSGSPPPQTVPVRMHRMTLAVAAMRAPIGTHDQGEAGMDAFLKDRDDVVAIVAAFVEGARAELPNLPVPLPGAGLALKGLPPLTWALRKRLPFYRWFTEATGARTPIHGLVALNRAQAHGGMAAVDPLMIRAFLADLRESYRRWSTQSRFPSNVLLLLDDVDEAAGGAFVSALLSVREEMGDGDPLLVVATTGRAAESVLAPHDVARDGAFGDGQVRVVRLLGSREAPARDHAGRVVREICGGHAWATERLKRATSELQAIHAAALLTPELVGEMADRLLDGCPTELRTDLAAAAAVGSRTLDVNSLRIALTDPDVVDAAARHRMAMDRAREVRTFVFDRLWTAHGPGGAGRLDAGLHPVLRAILLRRLAAAPAGFRSWTTVFKRLRDSRPDGARPSALWMHYDLARTGNVHGVAEVMLRQLEDEETRDEWLATLDVVVAAPRRWTADHDTYRGRHHAVVGPAPGGSARAQLTHRITAIVGGLWLSTNFSGHPELDEYLTVAAELNQVVAAWPQAHDEPLPDALCTRLYDRAEAYSQHRHERRFFLPDHELREHE
ncbi:MAG: hypothetical protein ACRDRH_25320 [Pseudonocardia sp.]